MITTLVIVEGSYIQGIFHSLEEEYMNQLTPEHQDIIVIDPPKILHQLEISNLFEQLKNN